MTALEKTNNAHTHTLHRVAFGAGSVLYGQRRALGSIYHITQRAIVDALTGGVFPFVLSLIHRTHTIHPPLHPPPSPNAFMSCSSSSSFLGLVAGEFCRGFLEEAGGETDDEGKEGGGEGWGTGEEVEEGEGTPERARSRRRRSSSFDRVGGCVLLDMFLVK